jgi:hypothetical protein
MYFINAHVGSSDKQLDNAPTSIRAYADHQASGIDCALLPVRHSILDTTYQYKSEVGKPNAS